MVDLKDRVYAWMANRALSVSKSWAYKGHAEPMVEIRGHEIEITEFSHPEYVNEDEDDGRDWDAEAYYRGGLWVGNHANTMQVDEESITDEGKGKLRPRALNETLQTKDNLEQALGDANKKLIMAAVGAGTVSAMGVIILLATNFL